MVNFTMKNIYKTIMLITGVLIILNVVIGLLFDYKWSDLINGVLGLVLILAGTNYSSKENKKES